MRPQLIDLKPYQGTQPRSNELLILNESFYLESRAKEIEPAIWYDKGTSLLEDYERAYLNYTKIFENKRPDGSWAQRGCAIYRNIESALKEVGYPEIHNMLDHCTLANCFLRPAFKGQSLVVHALDIEVSKEYVTELVRDLKPKLLICASSKAHDCVVKHLALDCKVVKVCHPACQWWNRNGGIYGRRRFVDAAKQYLEHPSPPPDLHDRPRGIKFPISERFANGQFTPTHIPWVGPNPGVKP